MTAGFIVAREADALLRTDKLGGPSAAATVETGMKLRASLLFGLIVISATHLQASTDPLRQLPLSFEQNRGQADPDTQYIGRGHGYNIIIGTTRDQLVLKNNRIGIHFRNSKAGKLRPEKQLAGRVNYIRGLHRGPALREIPTFGHVRRAGIYTGVDLLYYGNQSSLEYDLIVSPGADPRAVEISFDHVDRLTTDQDGNLHIQAGTSEVIQHKPRIYQDEQIVAGSYRLLDATTVGFEIGGYDRSRPLVIDPVLTYSTFIGGSDGDQNARGIVTDAAGNIYVTGSTTATNFPTVNALQPTAGSPDPDLGFSDAFVLKLNPAGSALIYSTYLGGSDDDDVAGIALDASGNVIVTGTTTSTDFPATSSAFRRQCALGSDGTCSDVFVAKLNATGSSLIFATYLGGKDDEEARGLAVDAGGNIYVAGETSSTDFPLAGASYSTAASQGSFIAKFSPTGSLIASTYFGLGAGTTDIRGIAADIAGNVYITGATPYSSTGATDVFVTKFNTSLSGVLYSSFIRGSNDETGNAIAVDATGNAYVTGRTFSRNFPVTPGAPQAALSGGPTFKTTDAGSNWSATSTGIPRTSLYALAITPASPGVIYVGADDEISGGVYKSADGGVTWNETDSGLSLDSRIHALAVDTQTPSIIYAGTRSAGLYKSTDSGKTWTASGLTNAFVTSIAIDPSNPATIYAGTNGAGIFRTIDGGATWAAVNNGLTALEVQTIAIHPSVTSTIYVGTTGGIFKSIDRAGTWNSSGAGLLDPNVNVLVIDPRNPSALFAGTSSVGIFRSLNGGSGWLASNSGIPSLSSGILVSALAIDPTSGTLFAAAGESNALTIYKSSNGVTWTSTGLATTYATALAIDSSTPGTTYLATVGSADAFVAKWDSNGALVYSTYLGGYRDDTANAIAIDPAGNAYVIGTTSSANFPVINSLQSTFGGGSDVVSDAFVAKVSPSGTTIAYSTYLGGSGNDFGTAVTVGSNGNAYVVGQTGSTDFPTAAPLLSQRGSLNAFVARISEVAAIPYSVTTRGGYTSMTQGGGSAIVVGYGRITPDAGSATPQGMAIFGAHVNGTLVSEAAVPASVPLSSGRIYAEVGGGINTGLAIANPNSQAATVTFYTTNNNGNSIQGSTTIGANSQIAAFLDQAPFNAGSSLKGTLTFTSSAAVAVVALRGRTNERGEFLITTLPVVDMGVHTLATGAGVLFPHYADGGGWTTQLVLVNPTDTPLSGSIEFYSQAGQAVGSPSQYTIPAATSFSLQTSGAPGSAQVGSIRVTPAAASDPLPSGVAIFSFRTNGVTVTEAGVPAVTSGNAFRLYAEASGFFNTGSIGSIQTGVAIVNLSSNPAPVSFELSALNGVSTGPSGSITIPGNGQTSMFLNQIPGLGTLPNPLQGVLRVSSTAPIAVIGLRGRYNERDEFLITTTPPTSESGLAPTSELYFPHFADGGGYTTQFILFNGSTDQSTSGTIRYFTQSGQLLSLSLR